MTNAEAMARVGDAKLVYRETYSIGADKKGNLVDKWYDKKKEEWIWKTIKLYWKRSSKTPVSR